MKNTIKSNNYDRLRLIELQNIASVARNNMGNYRYVEKIGYQDKIINTPLILLCLMLFVALFI